MLKLFNLFNIDEKYFADKKTVKKRFIKVFGGFLLIATAISPFTWIGFLFLEKRLKYGKEKNSINR